MKKFTKMVSFILTFTLIISIFPVARADAAEKKYKLALTGEYDLSDEDKVIYSYNKMLKNIKLEKVEGKNQWNLTMYAGTTVVLPYTASTTTDKVEVTTASEYVRGSVTYNEVGSCISVTAKEKYGQTKTVTNQILTCKSYNKAGKCLSTLKIVVKILPYSAKMERTKLVTAKELYELGYHRGRYSDFAWNNVISKYPEVLLEDYNPLYVLADHVVNLNVFEYKVPQYLYVKFGGEDADELVENIYALEADEVWGYDYDLVYSAELATREYSRTTQSDYAAVQELLEGLNLERYDTDWEKVLEIQKWVKANIKYKVQDNPSISKTLERGNGDCDCYAKLMEVSCRLLDIPCYVADDPRGWSGNGHAWNIVLVDGLWCTMDLTEQYVGFNGIDTGEAYMLKPNKLAVVRLSTIYGGQYVDETDLLWDCAEGCWITE